ncbi:hypothetical protein [Pontibacter fetidus]|uniref:Uncharacterized protein n=1 Tax=Pontibacter fetidus TaxID=2700082 RepID=A0A6B2GWM6_9BACT|nr:hypothetical protein [Pontibacter fetidus]NDK55225.1 hypothetical protein [Pontibacter fetidus]
MNKIFTLIIILGLTISITKAQGIDALKLSETELPANYKIADKLYCKSIQVATLYNSPQTYSFLLGNMVEKSFQSFESENEKGSVMFITFDKDVSESDSFIEGLIWGSSGKPTKAHPEEFLAKGNTLVIWSFERKSPIKDLSKDKVTKNL